MRTTLDLPDSLFRRLKSRAALEGVSMKDLLARYIATGLTVAESGNEASQVSDIGAAKPFRSAYDAMKDGCGIFDSGHTDLSTNPKHMEGFGRD